MLGTSSLAPCLSLEIKNTKPQAEEVSQHLWLLPGLTTPKDIDAIKVLEVEINDASPPLNNIRFIDKQVAAYIGKVADTESLSSMAGMDMEEAMNRAGELMARVSVLQFFSIFLSFVKYGYISIPFLVRCLCQVSLQLRNDY